MNGVSRALLCTAFLMPAVGMAQESANTRPQSSQFNYSYVELSYDETEYDIAAAEIDGDGLTLTGSYEINDEWHVVASYVTADLDFGIDLDTWTIGAGYVYPLREDIDLYGRVLYITSDADIGPIQRDDDGLGLQFRVRMLVADNIEIDGGIQYVDVEESDASLQVGARYHFTDEFSAGISLNVLGDNDGIGVNARYSF